MAIKLGTTGNDTITGTAGWDTLYGLAGDDILVGGTGNDILSGGDGNDTLSGGAGTDSLNGGAGADTFKYTSFDDANGDKIIDLTAEDGIDFSAIANAKFIGNAFFNGVAGEIRTYSYYPDSPFYTYPSYSYISIDTNGDAESDIILSLNGGFNFTETVAGSKILIIAADQTLTGTNNAETLTGGNGNDTLLGLAGNDTLNGGEGNDNLSGGDGNDTITGGLGDDILTGGNGSDVFRFTSSADFFPNSDNNYFISPGAYHGDTITDFGHDSGDQFLFAFQGISFIGDNAFTGTPGQYNVSGNLLQFDFNGDKTADTSIYLPNFSAARIALAETSLGSNRLIITPNKTLIGTAGNDNLLGGNGYDSLSGNAGNDYLSGGAYADTLSGGDGNDTLVGGLGADTLTGGAGNDTFTYTSLADMDTSNSYSVNNETITDLTVGDTIDLSALTGLSFVGIGKDFSGAAKQIRIFNPGADTLLQIDNDGDKVPDYTVNIKGNLNIEKAPVGTLLFQVAANKMLNGTTGNDILTGANGNDFLSGNNGDDTLIGGYGTDRLLGGDGNDTLIGGLGMDTLTGGAGNDSFKYGSLAEFGPSSAYNGDTITDFMIGDQIDLSAIAGLSFVGVDKSFSGVANQVQANYGYTSQGIFLQVDTNGDKSADYTLVLQGNGVLEETAKGSLIFQIAANKVLNGGTGNDALISGNGTDILNGNAGNDYLASGASADTLDGGDGNDTLVGGQGADIMTGGAGNDVFKYFSLAEWGDTITDFSVGDQINLSAIAGLTFAGVGKSFAGAVNQIAITNDYNYGTYFQVDTNGDQQSDYSLHLSPDLTIEETTPGSRIYQVAANKSLTGTTGNDTLTGSNGNDTLNGLAGNDILIGGYGRDVLSGGYGNDTLAGGLGADTLTGGAGNDTFKYSALAEIGSANYYSHGDTITDLAVGDRIDLSLIAGLNFAGVGNGFSGVANQIVFFNGTMAIDTNGDNASDYELTIPDNLTIEETAPGSSIFQVAANKASNGTTGDDTLIGGNGNDHLSGNSGNDSISGGYGTDMLNGGDGNDTLSGGLGIDTLTGGAGNDIFQYTSAEEIGNNSYNYSGGDTITDLSAGDTIDMSAIAGLTFAGLGKGFTGVANQLIIITNNTYANTNTTQLAIDTDGNRTVDYSLNITGNLTIEETAPSSNIYHVISNQILNGTVGNDTLTGGDGNDTLNGNAGNDILNGGYGADALNGGDGNDTLNGGLGADSLTGGAGNDVFKFSSLDELGNVTSGSPQKTIVDFTAGDKIDLSGADADTTTLGNQVFTFHDNSPYFTGVAGQLVQNGAEIYGDVDGDYSSDFIIHLSGQIPNLTAADFIL
ncbi:hypothetical protein KFZ76_10110 [Methylovulum psychrotolerans]|uniref:beta strand repeat-containing protein n=1 Tax=Methylovulum psychrotolerans TaxID=1704499 RepID=UPI001BFF6BB6|nr:calcium-binding protein [Methylovulum psychrotolerans]MBT9098055.1 hypothetical protein [Methylovulum psychrotolerans]